MARSRLLASAQRPRTGAWLSLLHLLALHEGKTSLLLGSSLIAYATRLAQQPYRDAGYSRADYHLHPQSILYGVHRALKHNLLDLSTFDLAAYEHAEKVETGDWNWITPGFVAFASPVEAGWNGTSAAAAASNNSAAPGSPRRGNTTQGPSGKVSRAFRNVLEEFENKNVKVVVR